MRETETETERESTTLSRNTVNKSYAKATPGWRSAGDLWSTKKILFTSLSVIRFVFAVPEKKLYLASSFHLTIAIRTISLFRMCVCTEIQHKRANIAELRYVYIRCPN